MSDITLLLNAVAQGDKNAASQVLPLVYDALRKLAAMKLAHEMRGRMRQLPGSAATKRSSIRPPSVRTAAASPRAVDRTVRLWQIDSGACQVLRGHTDDVFAAAFHKGGTRLATAGRDRAVWLWDLTRGEDVARLPGHTSYVWSLAFSPDGKSLVTGSGDGTVRLWDTAPLSERYQARREAELLRAKTEKLVEQLFTEKNTADAVVAGVRFFHAGSDCGAVAAAVRIEISPTGDLCGFVSGSLQAVTLTFASASSYRSVRLLRG
jgi:WD40 repeat protein